MAALHASKQKPSTTSVTNTYKTLKELERGQSCIATSRKYGVAKNTVSNWLKHKSKIFKAVEENKISKKRKGITATIYKGAGSAMYKWLKNARHINISINFNIFKTEALDFAKSLKFNGFHVSNE